MGPVQQKQQMRGDFSNHQRLKNYKIVKGKHNKQYMEVLVSIYDTKVIKKWQNDIKLIEQKECLFLPESFELLQQGRCGSSGTLKLLFEYFPFSLQNEIANRVEFKSPFNEQQLWFLLYQITSSVMKFQSVGQKSGDIRPKNIFINQDGLIKVMTQLSFPDEKNNYMKALEDYQPAYLSPEELAEFQKGIVNPKADPVLSQAFSIGLTMLDAGLLINSEELYEMKNLRFNIHKFHQSIIRWKQSNYSPFLIRTVENLLEINWYERPTAGEVRAVLQPYQEQIINLVQFIPSKQKSKAQLDSYQIGTIKSPQNQKQFFHQNAVAHQNQFRPQSPPLVPHSPINHSINAVKINSYHQRQVPVNHNTQLLPPFKNIQQSPRQKLNYPQRFQSGKSRQILGTQLSPSTRRQIMIPAQPLRVIPNSKVYLQQVQDKYFQQMHKY